MFGLEIPVPIDHDEGEDSRSGKRVGIDGGSGQWVVEGDGTDIVRDGQEHEGVDMVITPEAAAVALYQSISLREDEGFHCDTVQGGELELVEELFHGGVLFEYGMIITEWCPPSTIIFDGARHFLSDQLLCSL